jgi:hypothetical protein
MGSVQISLIWVTQEHIFKIRNGLGDMGGDELSKKFCKHLNSIVSPLMDQFGITGSSCCAMLVVDP